MRKLSDYFPVSTITKGCDRIVINIISNMPYSSRIGVKNPFYQFLCAFSDPSRTSEICLAYLTFQQKNCNCKPFWNLSKEMTKSTIATANLFEQHEHVGVIKRQISSQKNKQDNTTRPQIRFGSIITTSSIVNHLGVLKKNNIDRWFGISCNKKEMV